MALIPVLDDWAPAREVLKQLDATFAAHPGALSILIVDDGSTEPAPPEFGRDTYGKLQSIDVLALKKNLGHQRALATGLCHIADKIPCDAILVMDGDGQDDPADALRLAERLSSLDSSRIPSHPIVFAERTRRAESLAFRLGYSGYRILHLLLTGRGIRFGNFSIIPRERLAALTTEPMLWNHYAASVAGSRLPFLTLPTHRRARLSGQSHLSYVKLAVHGLSALSCYSEIIGARLLLISSLLFLLSVVGIVTTLSLNLIAHVTLPGWTSLFAGLLIVFLFQVITLASNFTLQIITARGAQPFLPARDYIWFIDRVERRYPRP